MYSIYSSSFIFSNVSILPEVNRILSCFRAFSAYHLAKSLESSSFWVCSVIISESFCLSSASYLLSNPSFSAALACRMAWFLSSYSRSLSKFSDSLSSFLSSPISSTISFSALYSRIMVSSLTRSLSAYSWAFFSIVSLSFRFSCLSSLISIVCYSCWWFLLFSSRILPS